MTPNPLKVDEIAGVILAGGRSSRMNFVEKPLLMLGEDMLLSYVIRNARRQVPRLCINTNSSQADFRKYGLPVIADSDPTASGPLSGIYSAMHWYRQQTQPPTYLASFPADVPFFPPWLVSHLLAAMSDSSALVTWCRATGQDQPLFSLWSIGLCDEIGISIRTGTLSPKHFFKQVKSHCLELDDPLLPGDFFNINTPEDLTAANQLLLMRSGSAQAG